MDKIYLSVLILLIAQAIKEFLDSFLILFQSMVQFQWHDGSTKNVHVDPVILSGYQVSLIFFGSMIYKWLDSHTIKHSYIYMAP